MNRRSGANANIGMVYWVHHLQFYTELLAIFGGLSSEMLDSTVLLAS